MTMEVCGDERPPRADGSGDQGALAAAPPTPWPDDVTGARRSSRDFARFFPAPAGAKSVVVYDLQVRGLDGRPEVPVRLYRPSDADLAPVLLYLNGGAFVAGDLDTFHTACLDLLVDDQRDFFRQLR